MHTEWTSRVTLRPGLERLPAARAPGSSHLGHVCFDEMSAQRFRGRSGPLWTVVQKPLRAGRKASFHV